MVAFVGKDPAAYLSFIVSPSKDGCVEARHVSHGIDPKFAARGIESQLYQAALERTKALGCRTLRGFSLNSKWC
jgi:ribosomal protein S18 acetylase RimI-like enzyme